MGVLDLAGAVVQQRVDMPGSGTNWPLAHPLFVALNLAQDQGPVREILHAWTPGEMPEAIVISKMPGEHRLVT